MAGLALLRQKGKIMRPTEVMYLICCTRMGGWRWDESDLDSISAFIGHEGTIMQRNK